MFTPAAGGQVQHGGAAGAGSDLEQTAALGATDDPQGGSIQTTGADPTLSGS